MLVIMFLHHVIDFPAGFDLLPVIQFAFLRGCDIQEIPDYKMRLFVITEQVKGILDVRHLFCIEMGLIGYSNKTDPQLPIYIDPSKIYQ